jgi:ribose transport system ATP-binding protein
MSGEQREVILEMQSITKRFPGVVALNDVSFSCRRGCVQALVGENGAGKSTLMKVMSGAYQPDSGKIIIRGEERVISHPVEAQKLGISIIYQEFNLVPYLSVAENIFMGREPRTPLGLLDGREMRRQAKETLAQLNLDLDVDAWARELPVAQQQMVEIAKALSIEADIIVMDEPTAALADAEVNILFEIVRRLKAMGRSVVFISHRLKEVFQIADTITVMRDGQVTAVKNAAETNIREITNLMVGRELSQYFPEKSAQTTTGKEVLTVRGLNIKGVLEDVNLTLREGEIVGVAGLEGHGQRELVRAIFGAESKDTGEVLVEGVKQEISSPRQAIEAGIAFVSDDRKTEGVVLDLSVLHNVALPSLEHRAAMGFVRHGDEATAVRDIVRRINVKTPTLKQLVVNLSGGNQQKVVLAKWLMTHPKVIVFSEPTRGIDVGAKEEIYRLMRSFAERGTAILMVSSELGEILGMSDRVLVMHEGRLVAELAGDEATESAIMHAAVSGHA